MAQHEPTLLALDPSLTGTGWAVINLTTEEVIRVGVITTKPLKKADRKGKSEAEMLAERGRHIHRTLVDVVAHYRPRVVVQEGSAGSNSAQAAGALARAQQACLDAIDRVLGAMPILQTQQHVKKRSVGRHENVSEKDMEQAMRHRWGIDDPTLLLERSPLGHAVPPKSEWNNFWDALGNAHAAWDHPLVAAIREAARSA